MIFIINGSPRRKGDTSFLIQKLSEKLQDSCYELRTYEQDIHACVDCRYCWNHPGCCVDDGMQKIYNIIQKCQGIVIASPIYFSELTGPLLSFASRLQAFYCGRVFQNINLTGVPKRGGVLLAGGGDGCADRAYQTAKILLHQMGVTGEIPAVYSLHTNQIPAEKDPKALEQIYGMAAYFNNYTNPPDAGRNSNQEER